MHYAYGAETNKRIAQLLSQFGFSENVYDKDGMTPLDFSERAKSKELQELIAMHKARNFDGTRIEPNPWTWQVWTHLQSERDTFKQLVAVSNHHRHHHLHRGCGSMNATTAAAASIGNYVQRQNHHHHHHHHSSSPRSSFSSTSRRGDEGTFDGIDHNGCNLH